MSSDECSVCGLAACDLPDGVDPALFFERDATGSYCPPHVPDGWWDINGPDPDGPTFADEWGAA